MKSPQENLNSADKRTLIQLKSLYLKIQKQLSEIDAELEFSRRDLSDLKSKLLDGEEKFNEQLMRLKGLIEELIPDDCKETIL